MPWSGSGSFPYNQISVAANAPSCSGVYALFNDGDWIYIGESKNIRDRLVQHLLKEDNLCVTISRPQYFAYEVVEGELPRKTRQNYLILELGARCNKKLG